jgi:hypothetical protein
MNYQTIFGPSIAPFITHTPNNQPLYDSASSGVTALNTKTGALTIAGGNAIAVDTSGQVITVRAFNLIAGNGIALDTSGQIIEVSTAPTTYGVASNIVWGAVGTIFFGAISVPALTDNGIVQVTVQAADASDFAAVGGPPIIYAATPLTNSGNGVISVYIDKLPLVNANYKLAWQVLRF